MQSQIAAEALVGIVAIFVLAVFWLGPWRWLVIDWSRDRMFAARDELFDIALAGHIDFADPHYREIRRGINDLVRYSHSVTLPRLILHAWTVKRTTSFRNTRDLRSVACEITNPVAQAAAVITIKKVEDAAIGLVIGGSPVVSIIILLCVVVPRIIRHPGRNLPASKLWERLRPYAAIIQAEAALS